MSHGFWVVSVNRETGQATTSELIAEKDAAWQLSVDLQDDNTYTTVVPRRPMRTHPDRQR
ncbi:hypothetical protein [Mycolicibacterium mageritense]|uniref:hypothetical protein n=1 Tax=Mycolicibacterium mageritense TaxID=53462 RepID=UPI001E46F2F2|nr:hypothetical protein [Mycolicibacterium mageritense]MCC9184802.1 hypothetical protein [Mycolicibacterium mageritense]